MKIRNLPFHSSKHKVTVNSVAPGFIVKDGHQSRFQEKSNWLYREITNFSHPVSHTGPSDEVANAVLLLCSPKASFITGQCLVVDVGLTLQEQSNLIYRYVE